MDKLVKAAGIFAIGYFTAMIFTGREVDNGDVVYDDDKMYVKADKNKTCGWSYAKVVWKDPED